MRGFGEDDGRRLLLRGAAGGKGLALRGRFRAMAADGLSWLLCMQACGCAEQQREQAEERRESVQRFLHLYRWTFLL
jgi:hypothetical protein